MAEVIKVRNKAGEARFIPALGIEVEKDEVFEVADELAKGLLSQSIFERVDAPKKSTEKSEKDDDKK